MYLADAVDQWLTTVDGMSVQILAYVGSWLVDGDLENGLLDGNGLNKNCFGRWPVQSYSYVAVTMEAWSFDGPCEYFVERTDVLAH